MVLDPFSPTPMPSCWKTLKTLTWRRLLQPLLQALFQCLTAAKSQPFANIPGPTPIFPLGNTLDFHNTPTWVVLGSYAQRYGGIARFWILFRPFISLSDPKLIDRVLSDPVLKAQSSFAEASSLCPLQNNPIYKFYKDQPRKALRPMLTDISPFEAAVADENWRDLRQNDPFSMDYLNDWLASQIDPLQTFLKNRMTELVEVSANQGALPAYDAIQKLTFDGFSLATVGQVFPDEVFGQFNVMCKTGTARMTRSTLANWPIPQTPWNRTYQKVSKAWFKRFDRVVRQEQPPANSLLDWVTRKGGTNFDAQKLRNFCAGVYPGGAVSTPSAIVSVLHLLDRHPEVRESLRLEIKDLFAVPLTLERLEACTQLDRVLRETLRLWPAVPFFLRSVDRENATELAGHFIPANTSIFISNWYLQRHSDRWLEPEVFNPSRWDKETCRQNDWGSDYFFPFGRGSRACIGQYFARYFMKLTLAVLLAQYEAIFDDRPNNSSDDREFYFGVAVPCQLKAKFVEYGSQ